MHVHATYCTALKKYLMTVHAQGSECCSCSHRPTDCNGARKLPWITLMRIVSRRIRPRQLRRALGRQSHG